MRSLISNWWKAAEGTQGFAKVVKRTDNELGYTLIIHIPFGNDERAHELAQALLHEMTTPQKRGIT
jgi:ferritin-like protein